MPAATSATPDSTRGRGRRWARTRASAAGPAEADPESNRRRPPNDAPRGPVTAMASPGWAGVAPQRFTCAQPVHGNRHEHIPRGDDVAAYQQRLVVRARLEHAVAERVEGVQWEVRRQSQRDDARERDSAHGCNVADIGGPRLPPEVRPRRGVAGEVDALNHGIGRGHLDTVGDTPSRCVVPDAQQQLEARGRRRSELPTHHLGGDPVNHAGLAYVADGGHAVYCIAGRGPCSDTHTWIRAWTGLDK